MFFLLAFFTYFLYANYAFGWEEVSLPSQTVKISEEEMLVNGAKVKYIRCRSTLSEQAILGFYAHFFPGLGWHEYKPGGNEAREQTLVFIKADNKIAINVIPSYSLEKGLEKGKKDILIAMQKLNADGGVASVTEDLDVDYEFFPRYPRGKLATSVSRDEGRRVNLTYTSYDSVEVIVSFFEDTMSRYGWNLMMKTDLGKLPPELAQMQKEAGLEGITLLFKGSNGQCIIAVMVAPHDKDIRIIGVRYHGN